MTTRIIDVALFDGETPEGVRAMLAKKFPNLTVSLDPTQSCPGGTTYRVTGSDRHLLPLLAWHGTAGTKRPDLAGKAPVGKGERR